MSDPPCSNSGADSSLSVGGVIDQTHSCWPSLPSSKCLGKEVRINDRQEAFNGLRFFPLAKSKQDGWTCYASNRGEWEELAMDGTHPPTMEPNLQVMRFSRTCCHTTLPHRAAGKRRLHPLWKLPEQGEEGKKGLALTRKELTQKPARARPARDELVSATAVLIRGGNDRKSGTEPKQRRWKVFRDPKGKMHSQGIF